jgi:hypothetical protein
MLRARHILAVGCLTTGIASADPRPERPMTGEIGFNTRHYDALAARDRVAFRSTDPMDETADAGTVLSVSLRCVGRTPYNTYVGGEAEAGAMVGLPGSNLGGLYAVAGVRGDLSSVRLSAELVGGKRWTRYALDGSEDARAWIAEPRVRADLWLGDRATVGAAAGTTLGDRSTWFTGVYLGISSSPFGRWAF